MKIRKLVFGFVAVAAVTLTPAFAVNQDLSTSLSTSRLPMSFPNYPKPYVDSVLRFDPPYQGGNEPILACWTECVTGPDGVSQMCFQVCDVVGNQ